MDKKPPFEDQGSIDWRAPLLFVSVIGVWLFGTLLMRKFFATWSESGAAGDTFGAVNALFSGFAFAGVVYSIHLQRRDTNRQLREIMETQRISEGQLVEMKAARELQAQPMATPSIARFLIERPRLFYTPPERRHSAQSRYIAEVNLSNPTQHPALGVNVSGAFQANPTADPWGSASSFLAALPPNADEYDGDIGFLFVRDEEGHVFDALLQEDPRAVPILNVSVAYKGTSGGHFLLQQAFQNLAPTEKAETLATWHSGVVGFGARFKRELSRLKQLKSGNQENDWDKLFESVKTEFETQMGDEEYIELKVRPIPNMFDLRSMSKKEFEALVANLGFPQMVSQIYDCPSEIDQRT